MRSEYFSPIYGSSVNFLNSVFYWANLFYFDESCQYWLLWLVLFCILSKKSLPTSGWRIYSPAWVRNKPQLDCGVGCTTLRFGPSRGCFPSEGRQCEPVPPLLPAPARPWVSEWIQHVITTHVTQRQTHHLPVDRAISCLHEGVGWALSVAFSTLKIQHWWKWALSGAGISAPFLLPLSVYLHHGLGLLSPVVC